MAPAGASFFQPECVRGIVAQRKEAQVASSVQAEPWCQQFILVRAEQRYGITGKVRREGYRVIRKYVELRTDNLRPRQENVLDDFCSYDRQAETTLITCTISR
jgi:hypothetical protein